MKTRDEVLKECGNMVIACWNYYSDKGIHQDNLGKIMCALDDILPMECETKKRQMEDEKWLKQQKK